MLCYVMTFLRRASYKEDRGLFFSSTHFSCVGITDNVTNQLISLKVVVR
jgi:hypothetical protein